MSRASREANRIARSFLEGTGEGGGGIFQGTVMKKMRNALKQRRDTTGQALRTFLTAAIRAAADLIAAEVERSGKNP